MPHSQASLCYCTPRTVTKRTELTFESLRYLFGGDHPSQTTHQTMSPGFPGLDTEYRKGGISTLAPRRLATPLQSLPPILHILYPMSMLNCSEGAWGLSVPLRVPGVFTGDHNFTELMAETAPRSLHHSCRSELTRQGISLP